MKSTYLVSLILVISAQAIVMEEYYSGFVEMLGFDAYTSQKGVDCRHSAALIVYDFKNSIFSGHQDFDTVLIAVSDILDKLKYEIKSDCKTFFGDFEEYMSHYAIDPEKLEETTQQNFEAYKKQITHAVYIASKNFEIGDLHRAGKAHAFVLRTLIGLEKDNTEGEGLTNTLNITTEVTQDDCEIKISESKIGNDPTAAVTSSSRGRGSVIGIKLEEDKLNSDQSSDNDDQYNDYLEVQREDQMLASDDL